MFFLWFISHIFFAFVLFFKKRLPFFFSIFVFLPIALIYLKKEPTYDLIFYYKYFEAAWDFLEPGFRYLILILNKMLSSKFIFNSHCLPIYFNYFDFHHIKKLFYENTKKRQISTILCL